MGWKSTKQLTRVKAIKLIENRLYDATNEELGNALESFGYGDNPELSHYGCNFWVFDNIETDNDDDDDELGYTI